MRVIAVLFLVFMAVTGVAKADDLFAYGSSFDVFLVDYDNVNKYADFGDWAVAIGGSPVAFSFDGASGTISATETSLGNDEYQVFIHVMSDGDVFPVTPNGGLGYFSAAFYTPFDLTGPAKEDSAIFDESGTSTTYGPADGSVYNSQKDPWNGFSVGNTLALGFGGSQGQGVDDLTLTVTATKLPVPAITPEPGTLTLLGTGLFGLVGVGRRKLLR